MTTLVRAMQARKILVITVESNCIFSTSRFYSMCHEITVAVVLSVLTEARMVLPPVVDTMSYKVSTVASVMIPIVLKPNNKAYTELAREKGGDTVFG